MMNTETALPVQALKVHLALNVKDVEQSKEFYRKLLGLEPSKARAGYAKFDVQNPPLNLTLNQSSTSERGALSHLGIQVASTEDVMAVRQTWRERGLITRDEMQTNCCYALQDKTWVRDPDGNQWEVFAVLEDNLTETAMCCVAATERPAIASSGQASVAASDSCCETTEDGVCVATCCAPSETAEPIPLSR